VIGNRIRYVVGLVVAVGVILGVNSFLTPKARAALQNVEKERVEWIEGHGEAANWPNFMKVYPWLPSLIAEKYKEERG